MLMFNSSNVTQLVRFLTAARYSGAVQRLSCERASISALTSAAGSSCRAPSGKRLSSTIARIKLHENGDCIVHAPQSACTCLHAPCLQRPLLVTDNGYLSPPPTIVSHHFVLPVVVLQHTCCGAPRYEITSRSGGGAETEPAVI
ncbi:unnamed protein product [Merluccius merluccius]